MKEKIVLVGAGSAVFTKGLIADFIAKDRELTVGLVDTSADALSVAEGLANRMIEKKGASIRVEASTDRRNILTDATAVICTVGVGGRRGWMEDILIPRKHGVYQPVGDTIMPGGLSRALRMIPAMVGIAEDIIDLCPKTLFFNYGNPMSAVCRGVRKATGANIIGLCHGVNHIGHFLAEVLGVEPADIRYNAVGLNHLTWFTEVRSGGVDLIPRLREIGEEKLATLFDSEGAPHATPPVPGQNPFSWELMKLYGAFPAVLDRHVCEFFPTFFAGEGSYYGATLGTDCFSMERTIEHGDNEFENMKEIARGAADIPEDFFHRSSGEHEQVVDIIDSIVNDEATVYSANLPNQGQVPNLPTDAIVESPAVADGAGIRAIQQAPLPEGLAATIIRPIATIETIVQAALEGSREMFIQALVSDGSVRSVLAATRLADDLISAHREYLPGFIRGDSQ